MNSYPIFFTFKDQQHKAQVHDYGTNYWVVYFTHDSPNLVKEYGYTVKLFAHEIEGRGKDLKDLERAIRKQLK
jgi:hypothetical protein